MLKSYNPIGCSPEKFYDLFVNNYGNKPNHSFLWAVGGESASEKNPLEVSYLGSTIRGVIREACANITVFPYSERRTYSRGKTEDIGSVLIGSCDNNADRMALRALEDVTRVKLMRVRDKIKK